jgi:hypothetical protein
MAEPTKPPPHPPKFIEVACKRLALWLVMMRKPLRWIAVWKGYQVMRRFEQQIEEATRKREQEKKDRLDHPEKYRGQ